MLFNSLEFAFFLPIVFVIYWFVVNQDYRWQNAFLITASYFFYGWWDWRFLSLIIISSTADYFLGLQMGKTQQSQQRRYLLWCSIAINLGLLGLFKYYNFFAESFASAFTLLGMPFEAQRLNLILPVGISFYTFQTLSYSIDIYRKEISPKRDLLSFFAFVSFFPQLVAGPIERATNFLPQFYKKRKFDYAQAADGTRQILWGLFKKVVIADNCALQVNEIFANYQTLSGSTLFLGGTYLVFQIYGDFSGYSDIAIGTAKLLGFRLMQNFNNPYFSTSTTELWRRWHISLSTWFRDYVFIPLLIQYRNLKKKAAYIATFITFLLLGIWHGANWTFVVFGLLQSVALSLEIYTRNWRKKIKKRKGFKPNIYYGFSWFLTMLFWLWVSILFRADNLGQFWQYTLGLVGEFDFSIPRYLDEITLILCVLMLGIERWQWDKQHGLEIGQLVHSKIVRWGIYFILVMTVLVLGGPQQEFVYFQF